MPFPVISLAHAHASPCGCNDPSSNRPVRSAGKDWAAAASDGLSPPSLTWCGRFFSPPFLSGTLVGDSCGSEELLRLRGWIVA